MGKSLKQLIDDKQAIADLAATQAGNKVQPTSATQNSSLLAQANSYVSDKTGINAKELLVKYVGQEPIDRLKVEANFLEKFPAIALQEYGLDAPRILLQRDPHANKKAIERASGLVGKAVGLVPGIGKTLKTGVNKLTKSLLKPLYPDDWLEDPDSPNPKFNYYNGLYKHTISNTNGVIGDFLNANKTIGQLKENIIPTGLAAASGLAFGAIKKAGKIFGGKTTKIQKAKVDINSNQKKKNWAPIFPSSFVLDSEKNTTTINDNEIVYYGGYQQLRDADFPNVGTSMYSKYTKKELEGVISLHDIYNDHFDVFFTKYNKQQQTKLPIPNTKAKYKAGNGLYETTDTSGNVTTTQLGMLTFGTAMAKYNIRGYVSKLALHGTKDKDNYNVIGIYSKDVLRYWDEDSNTWQKQIYPTGDLDDVNKQYNNKSLHLNYYTNNLSSDWNGEASIHEDSFTASPSSTLHGPGASYYANYTSVNGNSFEDAIRYWIKPVRWNKTPYSTAHFNAGHPESGNEILDRDYYFAKNTLQSQTNEIANSNINPYLSQRKSVLQSNGGGGDDRIKFRIGGISLLATLTGISDNTTPTWTDVKAVGSGFKFYLYDTWEREISFKFQMYAESETDLAQIWNKAEKIKEFTLPTNNGINGVFGKLISLNIGNLINENYGFLTQANLTVVDDSPWEITTGLQKPLIYEMDITYKVIANTTQPTHYQTQKFKSAFPLKTTPRTIPIDMRSFTPPQVGGPIPIDDIPVDPNANLTGMDLTGYSPLGGGTGNPLGDRLKEMDNAQNFNTSGTGVTGTPVTNRIPTGPVFTKDELEALNAGRVPPITKGAGYDGGGTIMIENTYPGDKPKWWQFRERKKYWNSQKVYMPGQ